MSIGNNEDEQKPDVYPIYKFNATDISIICFSTYFRFQPWADKMTAVGSRLNFSANIFISSLHSSTHDNLSKP